MHRPLLTLLLLGATRLTATTDDRALLWAISQVESGSQPSPDAAHNPACGARGRYQITGPVWFQHAPIGWPHEYAHDPVKSEIIAHRHLTWLKKHGATTEPAQLARLWRYGLNHGSRSGIIDRADYAHRVTNLYHTAPTHQRPGE